MSDYTQKRITEFLKAANSDLGSQKYKGDQMIPDYCMAVQIGQQLQAQLVRTVEVIKKYKKLALVLKKAECDNNCNIGNCEYCQAIAEIEEAIVEAEM